MRRNLLALLTGALLLRPRPARAVLLSGDYVNENVRLDALNPSVAYVDARPRAIALYRNGMRQSPAIDYTYSAGRITFLEPLRASDGLLVDYKI